MHRRKPDWLRIKLPSTEQYKYIKENLKNYKLNTICESGSCPNLGECWAARTATFMILGDICTRACRFCAVNHGKPGQLDENEPGNIALAVKTLNLKHCVLTSVTRDDLADGGAFIWADTIRKIKELNPKTTIESLIPDFNGNPDSIQLVIDARPDIISHNLETVRRLSKELRIKAEYDLSLEVIKQISNSGILSKSGIMVGIGETEAEVEQTMDDLLAVGCKIFTIGQYLQPAKENLEVKEYIKPEIFEKYKKTGMLKGFQHIESSPLTRSSFHSAEQLNKLL